jgi:hypothetical protein
MLHRLEINKKMTIPANAFLISDGSGTQRFPEDSGDKKRALMAIM